MPDILGQMFFGVQVGTRAYGWSEAHYCIGANSLTTALGALARLAAIRVQLLGAGVALRYMRVSDRLVYRDSQVVSGPQPGFRLNLTTPPPPTPAAAIVPLPANADVGGGDYAAIYNQNLFGDITVGAETPSLRCDFPYASYMVRMEGGTTFTARRQLYIRGNPDIVQHTDVDRPDPGPWSAAYTRYVTALMAASDGNSWGFRSLDTSPANPEGQLAAVTWTAPILPFTQYLPSLAFVVKNADGTLGGAVNWPVGSRVRLRGIRLSTTTGDKLDLNGIWTVATINNGVVTFFGMGSVQPYPVIIKPGAGRVQKFATIQYTKVVGRDWRHKKTGGPFDRPLGRQRTKRRNGSARVDP